MLDQEKSKEELIAELEELRRHVNRLDSYRYAGEGTSSLVNFHNTAFGESIGYAFEPTKEHITKLILFVSQGLEQNEKVLFIADKYSQETFEKALASHCPELDTLKNNHQFCLQQHTCFFIDEDRFSAPYAIEKISEIAQNAKAEGFSGLRIYHELTWEIKESNSLNSTFEYIQELNKYMGKTKCIALISYDQTLLPLDTILKTIRLHHKFIIRGELYDNIFYVEPELWDDSHHQTLSDISEFRYILNSLKAHKQIVNNLHETQNFLSLIFKNSEMSIFIVNVLKNCE